VFSYLYYRQSGISSVIDVDVSTLDLYSAPDREVGFRQVLVSGLSHFVQANFDVPFYKGHGLFLQICILWLACS